MLVFQNHFEYDALISIVFLCGSKFTPKSQRDKRTILKTYIEEHFPNSRAIILEENFTFKRTTKEYLSYDDAYLKGLANVEQLASLYADSIIILHETISTAAELGMFAINPSLSKKICLLVPDSISIESDSIGSFINLAFLNERDEETRVHLIRYYPDTEINRTSSNKSGYHTFFHDDQIGRFLGNSVSDFIRSSSLKGSLSFVKSTYGQAFSSMNTISYHPNMDDHTVNVTIHASALRIQLSALIFEESVRTELRKGKIIRGHIDYLRKTYEELLKNTLEEIEGYSFENYKFKIRLWHSDCDIKQAIGYFLYMMQATKLISLERVDNTNDSLRKVVFSNSLSNYKHSYKDCIRPVMVTEYGRLFK